MLIPVWPQRYAVRGIGLMLRFIASKKQGTAGPTPHILFNGVARSGVDAVEAAIRSDPTYASHCLTHTLKWYGAFSEPEEGQNFVWASGKPWSTSAWGNLVSVTRECLDRFEVK